MAFDPDKYLRENPVVPEDPAAMPGTTAPEQPKPWGERAVDAAEYYDRMTRLGINTFTFGMADRAAAVGKTLTGGSPSYSDALKEVTDESKLIRENNPQMSVAADVTGGMAGGLGLAKLGLTMMPRVAKAPWWGQALTAGGEGAVQGGLQGAGNTYSGNPMDYAENTGKGALMGGVLSLPGPIIGQVAGAAAKGVQNMWGDKYGIPGTLATAANTDRATLATLQNRGARAMLTEGGPAMKGTAQGAVLPGPGGSMGPGQAALENNLTARDRSASQAITGELNQTVGPAPIPSYVETGIRDRMQGLSPEYTRVLSQAGPMDTAPTARWMDGKISETVGETRKTLKTLRADLDVEGTPGTLDTNPIKVQNVRSEVKAMLREPEKYNSKTLAALKELNDQLDNELQTKIPGIRELDSQYAELGAQERAIGTKSEGSRAFDKGRETVSRPEELADTLRETAQPKGVNVGPSAEPFRLRQAARADLERIVAGNKNDLLVLENMLGKEQDWNAQKLAVMFGPEKGARIMDVLDNERMYRESFQEIVKGAKTAKVLASKEAQESSSGRIPRGLTAADLIIQPIQWAKDKLTATGAAATRDRVSQILATNDPQEIQKLIPKLLAAEPDRARRAAIVERLVQSGWTGGAAGTVPSTWGPILRK
jgi:hypothetical protein